MGPAPAPAVSVLIRIPLPLSIAPAHRWYVSCLNCYTYRMTTGRDLCQILKLSFPMQVIIDTINIHFVSFKQCKQNVVLPIECTQVDPLCVFVDGSLGNSRVYALIPDSLHTFQYSHPCLPQLLSHAVGLHVHSFVLLYWCMHAQWVFFFLVHEGVTLL